MYLANAVGVATAISSIGFGVNCSSSFDGFVTLNSLWAVAKLNDAVLSSVQMHQVTHAFQSFACNDLSRHQFIWIMTGTTCAQQPAIRVAVFIFLLFQYKLIL